MYMSVFSRLSLHIFQCKPLSTGTLLLAVFVFQLFLLSRITQSVVGAFILDESQHSIIWGTFLSTMILYRYKHIILCFYLVCVILVGDGNGDGVLSATAPILTCSYWINDRYNDSHEICKLSCMHAGMHKNILKYIHEYLNTVCVKGSGFHQVSYSDLLYIYHSFYKQTLRNVITNLNNSYSQLSYYDGRVT